MVMPKQSEIEIPLLQVINNLGGSGKPKEIYSIVTKKFPKLTEEDINEKLYSGGNKWTNRIQWVRQDLIKKGELSSSEKGVWKITEKGKQRINESEIGETPPLSVGQINLVEIYDEYEDGFKTQLLERLHDMTPKQFEEFAKKLLQIYGFENVDVTQVGPDGGIDGYGNLRMGLATMNAAFQCKRWKSNVGSKEIDQFRGAIQGDYEQGLFFTTSDFTPSARKKSIQKGAVPVILMNGNIIVDIMIEKGLGVEKKPLYLYYERVVDLIDEE